MSKLNVKGLMEKNNGYPYLSRDWEDIDCKNKNCVNNVFDKCGVASLAKIDKEGKCTGFKNKNTVEKPKISNPISEIDLE